MSSGLSWSTKGLQSVCPTGIATFDQLIGGGFALSSLNIIDEDCDRTYSSMVTKAYISSAIMAEQNVIIFSSTIKNKNSRFLKELPSLQIVSDNSQRKSSDEDSMKIAFRYSNLPSRFLNSQDGEDLSNKKLDFGNNLDMSLIEKASVEFHDHTEILPVLESLLSQQQPKSSTIYRILIDEIGSPFSQVPVKSLAKLFHRIKVLMRRLVNAVCLATLVFDQSSALCNTNDSPDLLECISGSIRTQIHLHADSVTRLIGFGEDSEQDSNNPYSSDYVGFLHLLRLPRLNSFAPYNPSLEATEFGLKLRNSKRYLAVEKLALPPDLGETVNRLSGKVDSGLPCASTFTNF